MHPFPHLKDLPPFEGDAIAQVWFDPWGVRFLFESGTQLYAELGLEHVQPDGKVLSYDCKADGGPPLVLHRLLYKRIVGIEREDFRLTFKIEGGATLVILSDEGQHDAGHLRTTNSFDVF